MTCLACGLTVYPDWYAGWRGFDRAHLWKGGGRGGVRRDDPRETLLICRLCHQAHRHDDPGDDGHGYTMWRLNGLHSQPVLTNANMCYLKRERDPEHWDELYLRNRWTLGAYPGCVRPDEYYLWGESP